MPAPDTRQILDVASRYVILKTGHGITVGLHLDEHHYGEAHSPANDETSSTEHDRCHDDREDGHDRLRHGSQDGPIVMPAWDRSTTMTHRFLGVWVGIGPKFVEFGPPAVDAH